MRKKVLIEQNTLLFSKLQAANKEISELKSEIDELNKKLGEADRDSASAQNTAVGSTPATPLENLNQRVAQNITLNNETEYAAKAIGRIVLEATKFCTKLGSDMKNKELVNLILGKSEVAKADILAVLSGEDSRDSKKIKIDEIEEQAKDYFNSVMAQEM